MSHYLILMILFYFINIQIKKMYQIKMENSHFWENIIKKD